MNNSHSVDSRLESRQWLTTTTSELYKSFLDFSCGKTLLHQKHLLHLQYLLSSIKQVYLQRPTFTMSTFKNLQATAVDEAQETSAYTRPISVHEHILDLSPGGLMDPDLDKFRDESLTDWVLMEKNKTNTLKAAQPKPQEAKELSPHTIQSILEEVKVWLQENYKKENIALVIKPTADAIEMDDTELPSFTHSKAFTKITDYFHDWLNQYYNSKNIISLIATPKEEGIEIDVRPAEKSNQEAFLDRYFRALQDMRADLRDDIVDKAYYDGYDDALDDVESELDIAETEEDLRFEVDPALFDNVEPNSGSADKVKSVPEDFPSSESGSSVDSEVLTLPEIEYELDLLRERTRSGEVQVLENLENSMTTSIGYLTEKIYWVQERLSTKTLQSCAPLKTAEEMKQFYTKTQKDVRQWEQGRQMYQKDLDRVQQRLENMWLDNNCARNDNDICNSCAWGLEQSCGEEFEHDDCSTAATLGSSHATFCQRGWVVQNALQLCSNEGT